MSVVSKIIYHPLSTLLRDGVETVRAVVLVLTTFVVITSIGYLAVGRQSITINLATAISAIAATIAVTVLLSSALVRRLTNFEEYGIVTCESITFVEKVGDHFRYTYTREVLVRARVEGVRLIETAMYRTGQSSKPPRVASLDPNHVLFDGKHQEDDHRVHRWLYIGRAMAKGETLRAGYSVTFEDDVELMRPFMFDRTSKRDTGLLRMTLRFPKGDDPLLVDAAIRDANRVGLPVIGRIPHQRTANEALDSIDYTISVRRPKTSLRYGLRWERSGEPEGRVAERRNQNQIKA
jgi:hypothetical protein